MDKSSDLCKGCGLCCDGSLFHEYKIDPSKDNLKVECNGIDLPVIGSLSVPQPCFAYGKGCCQIYSSRPEACRDFRCITLKAYQTGELSFEKAMRKVKQAIALKQDILNAAEAANPSLSNLAILQIAQNLGEILGLNSDMQTRNHYAQLSVKLAAFEVIKSRNFIGPDAKMEK